MKISIIFRIACAFFLSGGVIVEAQTLIDSEMKPPYISLNCGLNEGNLGALDINVTKLNVVDTDQQLLLDVHSDLRVCAVDRNKNFQWNEANPYVGFDVQYFNDVTNVIATRKAYIDPAKSYNRIALSALDDSESSTGTIFSATMSSAGGNSLVGTVTINKSEIFNQKDRVQLNRGETVTKIISLYHLANLTNEVEGKDLQLGDEGLNGRNIVLRFKKNNSK